jgi:hypothetical protein
MATLKCRVCQCEIGEARLRALPFTKVCVQHSTEKPVKGHMIVPHKTGSHIEIVSEAQHQYIQAHDKRKTYGANLPVSDKRN